VLSLLRNVEGISSCRDRNGLPRALLRAVAALLGDEADVAIFSRDALGETTLRLYSGPNILHSAATVWPDILRQVHGDGKLFARTVRGRFRGAVALRASELSGEHMILAYEASPVVSTVYNEIVASLARMYGNQISLLDYSELDTLTRLLNRKTFDETFDRLLTVATQEQSEDGLAERRIAPEEQSPAWLCVVDIDHFKRVNDSFGHLFGDEVLLRMGELMRKTFRGGDRLFRFGGEEFVVILNAADEALAAAGFDRFRMSVENHEFPQVGKVTCSIGFTGVSQRDVPTDVVGRADEALYFAKEHGRNQVCCYERLVVEGAISAPAAAEASHTSDFDIDALFG